MCLRQWYVRSTANLLFSQKCILLSYIAGLVLGQFDNEHVNPNKKYQPPHFGHLAMGRPIIIQIYKIFIKVLYYLNWLGYCFRSPAKAKARSRSVIIFLTTHPNFAFSSEFIIIRSFSNIYNIYLERYEFLFSWKQLWEQIIIIGSILST